VGVCVYIRAHTHTLNVLYSDVSPGVGTRNLENPKNLPRDGLNLGIYVFVHVYKVHFFSYLLGDMILLAFITGNSSLEPLPTHCGSTKKYTLRFNNFCIGPHFVPHRDRKKCLLKTAFSINMLIHSHVCAHSHLSIWLVYDFSPLRVTHTQSLSVSASLPLLLPLTFLPPLPFPSLSIFLSHSSVT